MLHKITLLCFIAFLSIIVASCKERNEDFPQVSWSTYYYDDTHQPVTAMLILNDHSEWFGLKDKGGLVYGNGISHELIGINDALILFDTITALLLDGNDVLWVGHKNGLAKYENHTWERVTQFQNLQVTSLALKGIGELWVGFHGTILSGSLAVKNENDWTFFPDAPSLKVNTLLVDNLQQLWIGTDDAGLFRMEGNSWTAITENLTLSEPSAITSLCTDLGGNIIAGTKASQLIRISNEEPVILTTGTSKPISSLLCDPNGKLWIATMGAGLITLDGSGWDSYTVKNAHLPSDSVFALETHPGHTIVAAFSDGHLLNFPY
jgi:ligand-binding sensor domain-containing protein